MLQSNIHQQFWRYSIPSVVAMVVNGIYLIVDGMFIKPSIKQIAPT
ncbi:hypothetical protein ACRRS0_05670 [Agarivorans sp. QJM3NY_29]